MTKLSRPVRVREFTFHGVDDWLAFCTDLDGRWHYFATECSPLWRELPESFIGECGYPDTDEGVLATAILEATAGYQPTPLNPEYVAELIEAFGQREAA